MTGCGLMLNFTELVSSWSQMGLKEYLFPKLFVCFCLTNGQVGREGGRSEGWGSSACAFLLLWIYGKISSGGICLPKWWPNPRVRFKCSAKIFHLKTKVPCKLDWLEEIFVWKHQSDQLWNKMLNVLANARIIQDLRREIYGLNRRLYMTDQQTLSLSNHQGSLLTQLRKQYGKYFWL